MNTFQQALSLSSIVPSPYNPRKHFEEAMLAELAASIKQKGVLEPILVRSVTNETFTGYEIAAGERRFRAARLAGLQEIPAIIRELSDGEAAEIAIIENAQRADLTPVEEARGFQMLVEQFGYTVEDAAHKMGLSPKTVAQRIRLLCLSEKALAALDVGSLPLGSAVHLSRLADEKLRAQATEMVLKGSWETEGKPLTPSKTLNLIRHKFMTELSAAGFPTADETLVADAGACTKCPHRSSVQTDLFDEVGKKDLCLNTACFAEKKAAYRDRVLAEAQQQGLKVLDAKEAKQVWRYGSGTVTHDASYVEAKEKFMGDNNTKKRSYERILGKKVEPVIAVDEYNVVHKLYPKTEVKNALNDLGFDDKTVKPWLGLNNQRTQRSEDEKRRKMEDKAKSQGFLELLQLVRATAKVFCPKFTTDGQRIIWRAIINGYLGQIWDDQMKLLAKVLEFEIQKGHVSGANAAVRKWLASASDEDTYVAGLLISIIRLEASYSGEPERKKPMLLALDELGFDLKALRAEHLAKLKEKEKGKAKGSAKKSAAKANSKSGKAAKSAKGGKRATIPPTSD